MEATYLGGALSPSGTKVTGCFATGDSNGRDRTCILVTPVGDGAAGGGGVLTAVAICGTTGAAGAEVEVALGVDVAT